MRALFPHGLFPQSHNRNVLLYYIINIALNMWFTEAVWYFYWGRFAPYTVVGLIFSITSVLQLVAVIPTGVLADMFGQKKSVVVGLGSLFIGTIGITCGQTIWHLFVGVIFQSIGRSFITGALDALVFESLKREGKSHTFDSVVSFNMQLTILVFALTVIPGGWMYHTYFRLAYILTSAAYGVAFAASFFMQEVHIPVVHVNHIKTFIEQHRVGFVELWLPAMRVFIIPSFVLFILMRMYDWGISKPTIALGFGFGVDGQSYLFPLLAVVCAVVVGQLHWFRKRISDLCGIFIVGVLVSLGFIASYFPLGYYGVGVMLMLEAAGRLSYAWIPALVNERIGSSYRATTLSTLEFIGRVPYIFLSYLAGMAVDHKTIGQFHATLGTIGLVLLVGWYLFSRKQRKSYV